MRILYGVTGCGLGHTMRARSLAAHLIARSQASHRLFEKNRTAPWKNTLWHTRAEFRMLGLVLTGRMQREVARQSVAASPAPASAETNAALR